MKSFMIVALVIFLGSAPVWTACAAEVYWDPSEEKDITITPKDLPLKIVESERGTRSLGELEIYDAGEAEPEMPSEPVEAVATEPIRPRPEAETPTYREPSRRTPSSGEGRPTVGPSRRERAKPTPATQKPDTKKEAPAAVPAEPAKPDAKKMPWGKSDEPTADSKKQLQWGKDK